MTTSCDLMSSSAATSRISVEVLETELLSVSVELDEGVVVSECDELELTNVIFFTIRM